MHYIPNHASKPHHSTLSKVERLAVQERHITARTDVFVIALELFTGAY